MKKLLSRVIPALLLLSFAVGCSNAAQSSQTIQQTADQVSASAEVSEVIDYETIYQAEVDEAIKQRDISKNVEFTPITATKEVKYGNLLQNFTNTNLPALICPDTENNILYFTNLSNGETLSKLENEVVTELLPLTAKSINLWDGYLYYICDTENPVGIPRYNKNEFRIDYTGDIYRYNISTGENELLIETDAFVLVVSDYGLDYTAGQTYSCEKVTYNRDQHHYHADFDGQNIVENPQYPIIDDFIGVYYGENHLEAADGRIIFANTLTGKTTDILSRSETCDAVSVVGDVLYYCPNFRNYRLNSSDNIVSKNTVCGLNLTTGELFESKNFDYATDYAIIGNDVFICAGMNFSVYEDGKLNNYVTEMHGLNDWKHEFVGLYTDGEKLYAADDRKGIYIVEKNEYNTGMIYYEIGGTPWTEE